MTREQIEKAAKIYIDKFLPDHIDYANINNEEDNYESGRNNALCEFGEEIFKAGSRWRINSVWHDCQKELPKREGEQILLEAVVEGKAVYIPVVWVNDGKGATDSMTRWSYISDLIPDIN